jgi:DNA-directed RNA polymerase specialized sigma subunit
MKGVVQMSILIESLEYLTDKREILQDQLNNYMQEKQKLENMSDGTPQGLKGIDYSRTPVQSTSMIKFVDAIRLIERCNVMISKLFADITELDEKIDVILNNAKKLKDTDAEIYYYRKICGYNQRETAELLGVEKRTIIRKEKLIKSMVDAV